MTKHTPGPWRVGAMGYSHYQIVTDNDAPLIIGVIHDVDSARLIAAAPELLEWLKVMVDCADKSHLNLIQQARAAIAKAIGDA